MSKFFLPHGNWNISLNNKTLVINGKGGWNEEAAIEFTEDLKKAAVPLLNDKWAILTILDNWELATPECEKHFKALAEWFVAHNCIRECHVYDGSYTKDNLLERYVPENKDQDTFINRKFNKRQDAISWLESSGFKVEL